MGNSLFGRTARIVIFPKGQQAIVIDDGLRIAFNCKKSPSSEPNEAEINVYNLNQETRNLIEELDAPLVLSAGYTNGDGLTNVFFGDIMKVTHDETPPNIVTTIKVGDGAKSIRDTKVSLSFAKNTPVSVVVEELAKSFGKPLKIDVDQLNKIQKKVFLAGYARVGQSSYALDQLGAENGFTWSIQDDEVHITTAEQTIPKGLIVLTPQNGLVGIPERNTDSIDKKPQTEGEQAIGTADTNQPKGWNVNAKLFPEILPNSHIGLQFKRVPVAEGFKVIEVEHEGDTHGDQWNTKMQVADL